MKQTKGKNLHLSELIKVFLLIWKGGQFIRIGLRMAGE